MRLALTMAGLLVTVAVVMWLAKSQVSQVRQAAPAAAPQPSAAAAAAAAQAGVPATATPEQVRQQMNELMQRPRPELDADK